MRPQLGRVALRAPEKGERIKGREKEGVALRAPDKEKGKGERKKVSSATVFHVSKGGQSPSMFFLLPSPLSFFLFRSAKRDLTVATVS
jgi:hypothetical protein